MLTNEDRKTIENFITSHNSELSSTVKKLLCRMLTNEDIKTIENFINLHNSELSVAVKKLLCSYNNLLNKIIKYEIDLKIKCTNCQYQNILKCSEHCSTYNIIKFLENLTNDL